MTRVKNFQGFMRSRLNESEGMEQMPEDPTFMNGEGEDDPYGMNPDTYGYYGANPEDDEDTAEDADNADEDGDEEEVTLDSLKAMIEDLTERVEKLEGGGEDDEEGAEGDEEGAEEGAEEGKEAEA